MDLQKAVFGERVNLVGADDKVVQNANVHQIQRHLEPLGQRPVCLAGLRQTRGVIVRKNDGCRVYRKSRFYNFPRIDAGSIDGTAKQLGERNDPMLVVQFDTQKDLVFDFGQFQLDGFPCQIR